MSVVQRNPIYQDSSKNERSRIPSRDALRPQKVDKRRRGGSKGKGEVSVFRKWTVRCPGGHPGRAVEAVKSDPIRFSFSCYNQVHSETLGNFGLRSLDGAETKRMGKINIENLRRQKVGHKVRLSTHTVV